MKTSLQIIFFVLTLLGLDLDAQSIKSSLQTRTSLIYSSDLYFPPDDPDDWFDLATVFASPETDILGIVLDQQLYDKRPQSEGTGATPLRQMFQISGHTIPYAIGLRTALKSPDDKGLDQPADCQKGVEMILRLLNHVQGKVVLLTVGTVRDIAAAFNRDSGLFHKKVSRIYLNAGLYGFPKGRMDVNLQKDRNAFVAIMKSGLPVYWAPCFGDDGYETYWQADQGRLLESSSKRLQNYFLYAFSKGLGRMSPETKQNIVDPVQFLDETPDTSAVARMRSFPRNMWSTASILDAADLKIYTNGAGEYTAARRPTREFDRELKPYSFKKLSLSIDDQGQVDPGKTGNTVVFVFHKDDNAEYSKSLEGVLSRRFGELH